MKGIVYEIQVGPYKQIGSTSNIRKRKSDHLRLLESKKHYNQFLQRVYDEYKEFKFIVLFKYKTREEAYAKEQELLNKYYGKKYYTMLQKNATGGSQPGKDSFMYGKKHSEETKKKIGQKHRGKAVTENTRLKLSQGRKNLVSCKNKAGEALVVSKKEYDNNPDLVGITANTIKLKARKKIYCNQDGLVHEGVLQAAAYYKVPPGQISENLNGKREKVGIRKYKEGLTFKLYTPS